MVLTYFDLVKDFVVDYLHCVCLGVTKLITNEWFDTENHREPFYAGGRKKHIVQRRLKSFRPPSEISRITKDIDRKGHWKGSELRSWLLHYSGPVMNGILPRVYYVHWLKFVTAMHVLLSATSDTNPEYIAIADYLLIDFVCDVSGLYGDVNQKFNVHQLLHIRSSVENWGPLWTYSTFAFEGMNGRLGKLFHGTQYVQKQIAEKFTLLRSLPRMSMDRFEHDSKVRRFFEIMTFGHERTAAIEKLRSVGCSQHSNLIMSQQLAIMNIGIDIPSGQVHAFRKMIINYFTVVSRLIRHGNA